MVHLAIFAKYWEAGKVKTRLARRIGDAAARDVYYLFLQHLVGKLSHFADVRTIVFTPIDRETEFRNRIPRNWEFAAQSSGDLGDRMKAFFRDFADGDLKKNILIGADTPELPIEYLSEANRLLENVQVVIGPSSDGGYYLIACRGAAPDIFDGVLWSTDQVLPATLEKLERQKVKYQLLPTLNDVDEFEDLRNLVKKLKMTGMDRELLKALKALELVIE